MISFMVSKAQLIRAAIKNYLYELKEDREDAEIAWARRNNPNKKLYTSEEAAELLKKKYGLSFWTIVIFIMQAILPI